MVALPRRITSGSAGRTGATFPYGKDPRDRNIRIAPTYPGRDELGDALEGLALCVELAAAERLLAAGRPA
ncbi:hypothetical protein OG399_30950 [Streptomyces achromogenes]|uniref:Uncharacterized protein n=1 Tax=Streptomyces achromogenes TaxID=67255 RepID=A0ABZ1KJN8_STRAH